MPANTSKLPIHKLAPLIARQKISRQQLKRTPEPVAETNDTDNVDQYSRVGETRLIVSYAIGLEMIDRLDSSPRALAYDFASGPGRFTTMLHTHLGFDRVIGIDLAPNMVAKANKNAYEAGCSEAVSFQQGNVTRAESLPDASADFCCFADAAHHLDTIDQVSQALAEMERVTKPDGAVMLMDLVRLKTDSITHAYVELVGKDYLKLGLPAFKEDFRNSMYAAWTCGELRDAAPQSTSRSWYHTVALGMPCVQFLIGIPAERDQLLRKDASRIAKDKCPTPAHMRGEWKLLRQLVFNSPIRRLR